MKNGIVLIVLLFAAQLANAQFIKEKSINAQIGLGLSYPYESSDNIASFGFFTQGELVLKITSWFALRPYAGLIITNSDGTDLNDNPTNERTETKAFLLGGKARVRAPIPWVAPYIELGLGASVGKFETFTIYDSIDKGGIIYHIPVSFGLELGRNHNVDLGLYYFYQPTVRQYLGSLAVGVTFPI
ncbi:outer membrane beta-barrel protein [Aequorivita echinoideorum]|uniref:Outer membrane protein beta-barrel domain-containing protein n=1 Tax=Aequorivita echinoideorum TaxID=1549647 RepID=A0ABS5S211_9FLAO|nr:outer membrane beta-barrel protein [Aequorivita echinoideorum]MBT0607224.1 hypothetical protein [Aequorivita echinoideorum]